MNIKTKTIANAVTRIALGAILAAGTLVSFRYAFYRQNETDFTILIMPGLDGKQVIDVSALPLQPLFKREECGESFVGDVLTTSAGSLSPHYLVALICCAAGGGSFYLMVSGIVKLLYGSNTNSLYDNYDKALRDLSAGMSLACITTISWMAATAPVPDCTC